MDIEFDVTPEGLEIVRVWAARHGARFKVIKMMGPAGGNPLVRVTVYKNRDLASLARLELLPE